MMVVVIGYACVWKHACGYMCVCGFVCASVFLFGVYVNLFACGANEK